MASIVFADCKLAAADAFADAANQEETTAGVDYVHIRVQQRNGKKSLTTVQVSRRSLLLGWNQVRCFMPYPFACFCRASRSLMTTRRC